MSASTPQDQKKEEFKQYLDNCLKAGVLELLTSNLVKLYEEPEKPNDALEYLKNNIGGSKADKEEITKLISENDGLKKKIEELERKEVEMKKKLTEVTAVALKAPEPVDKIEEMAVADAHVAVDTSAMDGAPIDNAAIEDASTDTTAVADTLAVVADVDTSDTKTETPAEAKESATDVPDATDGEKNDEPVEEAMDTEDVSSVIQPATEAPADVTDEKTVDAEPNATEEEKEAEEAPKDAESSDK